MSLHLELINSETTLESLQFENFKFLHYLDWLSQCYLLLEAKRIPTHVSQESFTHAPLPSTKIELQ